MAFAAATLVALMLTATALALTRRHDVDIDDMHEFGITFRSVGWIKARAELPGPPVQLIDRYCSAVLVNAETAITAAHCVTNDDHEIDIDLNQTSFFLGDVRLFPQVQAPIASVEVSAGWACDDCESQGLYRAGWDVAILHFGTVLFEPTVSRIYVGDMVGRDVAVVGYGKLSTGLESFDDFGASAQDGRKMAGTNVVDRLDDYGNESEKSYAWLFDFDSPSCDKPWVATVFGPATSDICPTDLEASYGAGDSGGPMFVNIDGEWMLTGVASSILALDGQFGRYGQMAFVSNVTLDENRTLLEASGLLDNALVATATPTPTPTLTPSPTPTATATPTPTMTPTTTPTPTPSPTPTMTPTATPSPTSVPSPTPVPTASPTPTMAPTTVVATSTPIAAPEPVSGGSCGGGGAADGALLLMPLGLLLLALRRSRSSEQV